MNTDDVQLDSFRAAAAPEIVKLAKHFNVKEPQAVEAYGHLMLLTKQNTAILFDDCIKLVKGMLMKTPEKLTYEESRIGLCLGLLRVKQKPFLSDPKLQVGRNEPCPCGSGAKFKRCCLDAAKKHNLERHKSQVTGL